MTVAPGLVFGEAEPWEILIHRSHQFLAQGRYEEARITLSRALSEAEEGRADDPRGAGNSRRAGDPRVSTTLNNLGKVYQYLGRYVDAETAYRRAIGLMETQFGPSHVVLAKPLANLGSLYVENGKYGQAESLQRRSLELRMRSPGPAIRTLRSLCRILGRTVWDRAGWMRLLRCMGKRWRALSLNPAVNQSGQGQMGWVGRLGFEPIAKNEAQEPAPALIDGEALRGSPKTL